MSEDKTMNEAAFACVNASGVGPIGLTKREYASIHLGVPNSGQPWLDDMIRESNINKNDLAEHIAKIIGHDISCLG